MSRRKPYFKPCNDPLPLTNTITRCVRFEEVDPLAMVWHGRYPSYFEDGRTAFGDMYGISYLDIFNSGFRAPIAKMHIDYILPLYFKENFTITTILHWNNALRLDFEFIIKKMDNRIATTGYTVQLFTDDKGQACFVPNDFINNFRKLWQNGSLCQNNEAFDK